MSKHLRVPDEIQKYFEQQASGTGENWSTLARAALAKIVKSEKHEDLKNFLNPSKLQN